MSLPTSGEISLSDIQSVFGGDNPINVSEYVRGGSYVQTDTLNRNSNIPTTATASSNIDFSDYHGSSNLEVWGVGGAGVGVTQWEIIAGMKLTNISTSTVWFDDTGAASFSGPNIVYTNKIGYASPGDEIEIDIKIIAEDYEEHFEFWHYNINNNAGWHRFDKSDSALLVQTGGEIVTRTLTINQNHAPGFYGIGGACSYDTLGATEYRSWRSYTLVIR